MNASKDDAAHEPSRAAARLKSMSLLVSIMCLLVLARILPVRAGVDAAAAWIGGLGWWGPLVFGGIYIAGTVAFFPCTLLGLASAPLLGIGTAMVTVSLSSTFGAALAFLIARYLARDGVERLAHKNPRFAAVDRAVGQEGWKVVALVRLATVIPYNLSNYAFGVTSVRFGPYVLATWLAMMPGTFTFIYLGYLVHKGLAIKGSSSLEWGLLGVGLGAALAALVYVTKLARRAMQDTTPQQTNLPVTRDSGWPRALVACGLASALLAVTIWAWTQREVLVAKLGPQAVSPHEAYKGEGQRFDHADFDAVLKSHVRAGFVDYAGLKADAEKLNAYLERLAHADLNALGRDERLALLLNAYNAYTLRLILDRYPLDSIKDIPETERWLAERWLLGGRTVSLDALEHREIRPNFREPRIHFALVCAAKGCPPLRSEAYSGERLEEQLADQTRIVHTDPRWCRYDAETKTLYLTRLYHWYRTDFDAGKGILNFPKMYLEGVADEPNIAWLDYDWSLNVGAAKP